MVAAAIGSALGLFDFFSTKKAVRKSGKVQQEGAQAGIDLSRERFGEVREGLQPFITGGQSAFEQQQALSGALGPEAQATAFQQFQDSPGTGFLREQGLRLIDTGAAARGGLGGGERLRELTRFSQGLALQDLGGTFNRLGVVSGAGLTAAQAFGSFSGQASGLEAGLLGDIGTARAESILGGQKIESQGLGRLANFASDLFLV